MFSVCYYFRISMIKLDLLKMMEMIMPYLLVEICLQRKL